MDDQTRQGISAALGRIPQGLFILTARHEDRRAGILASWVQQCCAEPPMVSVAVAKGRPIMPLISESRRFGLCQLGKNDKIILRKFTGPVEGGEDPFLGLEMLPHSATGVPVLAGTLAYVECEVVCHMDVEGDHDLFVGAIRAGGLLNGDCREPQIHLRTDGLKY